MIQIEDLNEYQNSALRTAPAYLRRELNARQDYLNHGAMGIMTEAAELLAQPDDEENVQQELGDIMWYLGLFCAGLGVKLKDLDSSFMPDDPFVDIILQGGILLDQVKRHIYYSTITREVETDVPKCLRAVGAILKCVEELADDNNIIKVCEKNIEKLFIRYPDQFDGNAAVNRDVKKELKVFQG